MTTDIDNAILKKLDEQEKEEGTLPLLFNFYRNLLQTQSRAKKRIGTPKPALSSKTTSERIKSGLPLVSFDEIVLDWPLLRETFVEVVAAFAEYPELFGEVPEKLKKPGAGRLLTKKAVRAWFKGSELPPSILTSPDKEKLLQAIIHATLKPFMEGYSKALISSVDQKQWRQKYCPICGGSPDFSSLDKELGSKWLLCSRCDTEWLFQRLECPYCDTKDQNALAYFTDDEGQYRLYVCEKCKRYLKAIDLRQAKLEVLLPLERLYTLDIDTQARQQGYTP